MEEKLIAMAIPFFILTMLWEIWLDRKRQTGYYRFNDTLINLAQGVGQQALTPLLLIANVGVYAWVYDKLSFFQMDGSLYWHWIVGLLLTDFCYYWFHRAGHRSNLFLASHIVHHQSEEYNLSVALRQSWTSRLMGIPFFSLLALAGVPTKIYLASGAINLIYQYWVHTRYLGRLGWMEKIFITPSHHRVHHGRNPQYVDKNYGGIFIIWDKMFGTFEEEKEEVSYGILGPVRSWNPAWCNIAYVSKIFNKIKQTSNLGKKAYAWIAPPEWSPQTTTSENMPPKFGPKYDLTCRPSERYLVVAIFLVCLGLLGHILTTYNKNLVPQYFLTLFTLIIGLEAIGAMLEHKSYKWTLQGLFALGLIGVFVPALTPF